MILRTTIGLSLLMGIALSGCARYEYDVVKPAEAALHVPRGTDAVFVLDPLEYRLRTVENRLVMRVFNPTEAPIDLLGSGSFVVDSAGESHPLMGQTIAPGSFVKLILPPFPARATRVGPSFGIGLGVSSGGRARSGAGAGVSYPIGGDTYVVHDSDAQNLYWEWEGESGIRLRLAYRADGQAFQHDLAIERRKMR